MDLLKKLEILAILVGLQLAFGEEIARYDNYRVYQVTAKTKQQLNTLNEIQMNSDAYIFLESGHKIGDKFTVIVPPHKLADFAETMAIDKFCGRIINSNLQQSIDDERNRMQSKRLKGVFDWTEYHDLGEIHAWLDKLATEYKEVEVIEGGKSYEGRSIKGVKLSYKLGNPGIFVEGGIHAREWISPATVTYILNELLNNQDASVRKIAENYDWYIFPSVNPDGYVYSHTRNRYWRKTRTPYPGGCFGADPNRNWDFYWAVAGASRRCYAESFAGPKPFSEMETKSLSKYISSLSGKIQAYIAFHSYSQLLLFPYGHTNERTPNHDDLDEIANATVTSLAKRYGTQYRYGNIYDAIYPASGSSSEWAYGVENVKLSYTYELRPMGGYNGFVLPPEQIIPTGEETLDSLVTMLEESEKRNYFKVD